MPLQSQRLILREWKTDDFSPFFKLNSCKHVCEFLPKILNRKESDSLATRIISDFNKNGFGLYAVERKDNHRFIGFTGLSIPRFEAPFMPSVEIGWRLSYENWGQDFATETAQVVRDYAFTTLGINELVSFTVVNNIASRRVMEKIGMSHTIDDDFAPPFCLQIIP